MKSRNLNVMLKDNPPPQSAPKHSCRICSKSTLQVMAADPIQRELCLGLPVASGDPVVLQHRASGLLLCREAKVTETDFGAETLVTAHTLSDPRRQNFLEKTAQVRHGSPSMRVGL